VDARDASGATALLGAAAQGSVEAVERLLARGADPKARDAKGRDAAAHMEAVETFLVAAIDRAKASRALDPRLPDMVARLETLRARHAKVRARLSAASR
jgi:ankyrin repeat protein